MPLHYLLDKRHVNSNYKIGRLHNQVIFQEIG